MHPSFWYERRWQWCWWHRYVGDFMMVTELRCWWQNHYVGDFFCYVDNFSMYYIGHQHPESVTNISKLSSTHLVSKIRHQHRWNHEGLKIRILKLPEIQSKNISIIWKWPLTDSCLCMLLNELYNVAFMLMFSQYQAIYHALILLKYFLLASFM